MVDTPTRKNIPATPMALSTVAQPLTPMALSTVAPVASSTVRRGFTPMALSTVGDVDPRVRTLDRARAAAKLSHGELCRRAGVDVTTWARNRKGQQPPRDDTLDRLRIALAGDDVPQRVPLIAALHRMAMIVLAIETGANVDKVMRQDFSAERPANPDWLRASQVRCYATYLLTVELDLGNATVGRAIGCSREAVSKARRFTGNAMEDPALATALERCARLVKGAAS